MIPSNKVTRRSLIDEACSQLSCLLKREEKYYSFSEHISAKSVLVTCNNTSCVLTSRMDNAGDCAKKVANMSLEKPEDPDSSQRASPRTVSSFYSICKRPANSLLLSQEGIEVWRQQLFDWSNLVVDSHGINRE